MAVTNFVTNFFLADSKKYQADNKNYLLENKKYQAGNRRFPPSTNCRVVLGLGFQPVTLIYLISNQIA